MGRSSIADIEDVLTREKAALLAGDYDALGALEQEKERVLVALTKANTPKAALTTIQSRISENQALLRAAIKGVDAARKRIGALKDVQQGLTVYDRAGKMATVRTASTVVEKKA